MSFDKEIFKGKTLSNLFEEIYDNSSTTRHQVRGLIGELKELIEGVEDASLVVPLIKEYLEISVKNDEHLIKLATVIQRIESVQSKGESFDFPDIEALLAEQAEVKKEVEKKMSNDGL